MYLYVVHSNHSNLADARRRPVTIKIAGMHEPVIGLPDLDLEVGDARAQRIALLCKRLDQRRVLGEAQFQLADRRLGGLIFWARAGLGSGA